MPPRAYVFIFACWALLAVITPTLISWSASAKPNHLVAAGGALLEIKVSRRMMGSSDAHQFKTPMAKRRDQAPSPAPAPAPLTIKLKS